MVDVAPAIVPRFLAALAARDPAAAARAAGEVGLADAVIAVVDAGLAAWPVPPITGPAFAAWAGARITVGEDGIGSALASLRGADLYLACACAHGHADALVVLEASYLPGIRVALRAMRAGEAAIDETIQRLRTRLLVGDGGAPRIGEYAGRGDLRRWLRAAAVHLYLNELRGERRAIVTDDERVFDAVSTPNVDPALAHMKELYREQFKEAFVAAVATLSDQDKNLLRYRHVDELGVDEVAAIYRVHRATMHRWLASARAALAAATEQALQARLGLPLGELASIRRLVASQIDLSLVRVLGGDATPR